MKYYDYGKAKEIIENAKEQIERASLGMYEDWFRTAECVYKQGKYSIQLNEGVEIAGITGSRRATPALRLHFKNEEDKIIECFVGDGVQSNRPIGFSYGPISGYTQLELPELTKDG